MDRYNLVKEKMELNALVYQKEDVENPIFRIDMLMEKVSPKQIYDVLINYKEMPTWFEKCVQCKLVQEGKLGMNQGDQTFSTVFKSTHPLNNREFIHRRFAHTDSKNSVYMISYSSIGLENYMNPAEIKSSKYHKGFFSLCGIILRPAIFNEEGEIIATKLFYINQMEFTGCYVPA